MPFVSVLAKVDEIIDFDPGEIRALRLRLPESIQVVARPGNAFWLKLWGRRTEKLQLRAYSFSSIPRSPIIETVIAKATPEEEPDTSWTVQEFDTGECDIWARVTDDKKLLFINPRKDLELESDEWWQEKKFLFYGLGTGVTPHLSAVRYMAEHGMNADVVCVASAKNFRRLIFHSELEALARRFPNFRYVPFLTRENPAGWLYHTGRPTVEVLAKLVPDIAERHVRLCGGKNTKKNFVEAALAAGMTFPSVKSEEW